MTLLADHRGITLMELLVASSIGVIMLLALAHVDVTRLFIGQKAQGVAKIQLDPGLAVTHMTRSLIKADRIEFDATCNPENPASCIKLRLPPADQGANLDDPDRYTWMQYRLGVNTNTICYFDNIAAGCAAASRFADVGDLGVVVTENNIVEVTVQSTPDLKTAQSVTFRGQAIMRAGNPGLSTGLLPTGVGDSPALEGVPVNCACP